MKTSVYVVSSNVIHKKRKSSQKTVGLYKSCSRGSKQHLAETKSSHFQNYHVVRELQQHRSSTTTSKRLKKHIWNMMGGADEGVLELLRLQQHRLFFSHGFMTQQDDTNNP